MPVRLPVPPGAARADVRRWLLCVVALVGIGGSARAADDVTVYLTADEAMKLAFPAATRFDVATVAVPESVRVELGERLGEPFPAANVEVRRAFVAEGGAERLVGRAVLNDDVGKYRPITYLVAVDDKGEVVRVELLVYRESHGGEVRARGFLDQYDGKSAGDSIRVGKDITSISGATLSARAISKGVKRTLLLLKAIDAAAASPAPSAPSVPSSEAGAPP